MTSSETQKIVVNNPETGENSYLALRPYSRLFCGYSTNTSTGLGVAGVWERFPYPSEGYAIYREHDFEVSETQSRFTFTGVSGRWFNVVATCNIAKASGANGVRTMGFIWRKNGTTDLGPVRKSQMNRDVELITGSGEVYLLPGDYIEPWFVNYDNSDTANLTNCAFQIVEEPDNIFLFQP